MVQAIHKRFTSFGANQGGMAGVEFAFVLLPLCALLIAIFQIGQIYFAENELETATEKAARMVLTGQAQKEGLSSSQFIADMCPNLPVYFNCNQIMVDVKTVSSFQKADTSAPTLTYDKNGNVTNQWNFDTGTNGSIIVMRVIYQFPVFLGPLGLNLADLPNGKHLMMETAVFAVEPSAVTGS